MTTHFPNLATTPPPMPTAIPPAQAYTYADRMRHPGDPITQQRSEFIELGMHVRGFLARQVGKHTRDAAPRMLWVQGRPGEGKTEGCLVTALNAGFSTVSLGAGDFAGEVEGASVKAIHEALTECVRWSAQHRARMVVLLDDFDLSSANVGENVSSTINSQLLVNHMMMLADQRQLYRNVDGSNIAFIVTVNDASGMRESLIRCGRAEWHDHIPTPEDKANIAHTILDPKTSVERDLVRALVRKHSNQPVAFWKALYQRMQTLQARPMMVGPMPDVSAINAAYGRRLVLNPDIAWQAAKELRTTRVRSFLNMRLGGR